MKRLIALIFAGSMALPLFAHANSREEAQEYPLWFKGTVISTETGKPVPGIAVVPKGGGQGDTTNKNGRFWIGFSEWMLPRDVYTASRWYTFGGYEQITPELIEQLHTQHRRWKRYCYKESLEAPTVRKQGVRYRKCMLKNDTGLVLNVSPAGGVNIVYPNVAYIRDAQMRVRGRVVDEQGNGVANISLAFAQSSGWARTDENGYYSANAFLGAHRIYFMEGDHARDLVFEESSNYYHIDVPAGHSVLMPTLVIHQR